MPIAISFKIKNVNELRRNITRFPRVAQGAVADAINRAVTIVEQKTKPLTPVKTGKLRAQFELDRIIASPTSSRGAVRNTTPYALAVHNLHPVGTFYRNPSRNRGARAGFLILGRDKAEAEIDRVFEKALDFIIDETRTIGF